MKMKILPRKLTNKDEKKLQKMMPKIPKKIGINVKKRSNRGVVK